MQASITVTLLDNKSAPPEVVETLRMKVQEVITGEHGKRLVRQLNGATGLSWSIVQSPLPKGIVTPRQEKADIAQRRRETEAYFAQRRGLRIAAGHDAQAPAPVAPPPPAAPVEPAQHGSKSTDAAVRQILRSRQS